MTLILEPLVHDLVTNEYTYDIEGLVSRGSVTSDSVAFSTDFDVAHATLTIYEDPSQDGRPAFYDCPSGLAGHEGLYTNGTLYLKAHVVSFKTTYDRSTGQGTYSLAINWDSGARINELPPDRRGSENSGSFTQTFACIPAGYSGAATFRVFRMATPAASKTWGSLRRLYR